MNRKDHSLPSFAESHPEGVGVDECEEGIPRSSKSEVGYATEGFRAPSRKALAACDLLPSTAHQQVPRAPARGSPQSQLLNLVKQVAQEEGFGIERLEEKYAQYYGSSTKNGHRCVDGRSVLETYQDGSTTGYKNEDYLGNQFPGGTFGIIGVTRVVAGLDESRVREVVQKVCDGQGLRMGNHIDDGHGKIRTREGLERRTRGCGNQDAAGEGKIPMYKNLVNREVIEDRFGWLKSNGGAVPVLIGEHEEKLAAVNLKAGKTFNTSRAVTKAESIFNSDLGTAYKVAGHIFEMLATQGGQHQGPAGKEDFQKAMVKAVVRDYMQTLVALGGSRKIFIHADSKVEI